MDEGEYMNLNRGVKVVVADAKYIHESDRLRGT